MFNNNKKLKDEVGALKAEVAMLEGSLKVKDKEIAFLTDRGNRYFHQMETLELSASKLLDFSKEVLLKTIGMEKT